MHRKYKEIRRNINLPLSKTSDWETEKETSDIKTIIERNPEILAVFEKRELPLITVDSSIATLSLHIINKRIKSCVLGPIKVRTLQEWFKKIPS